MAEIISTETARTIASEWHGGQWSPLYAFASSGMMVPGFERDINLTLQEARASGQYREDEYADLVALAAYAAEMFDPREDDDDDI